MKKILLIGGGGHCASVADSLLKTNEYDVIGVIDRGLEPALLGCIPFLGTDDDLPQMRSAGFEYAFVTVGSVGNTALREKLFHLICETGFIVPDIIDPSAIVSEYCTFGAGVYVGKRAVINARATIDDCAIINTAAVVEHDCSVASFAHIAPSATLCGNAMVEFGSHVGAGSVVKQGVRIGSHSTIGIGSVVTEDISSGVVAYGNPCRKVRQL